MLLAAQRLHPDAHFIFLNQGEPPHVARWLQSRQLALNNSMRLGVAS